MDEIKVIREALEYLDSWRYAEAIDALNRLETRELETREAKKTVPMAMLRELMDMAIREGGSMSRAYKIVNAHGYEVTE